MSQPPDGYAITDTGAAGADAILNFWFNETKPNQWFRRDDDFDQTVRTKFSALHKHACEGKIDAWRAHPRHALALIILLDQFSRNIFRDDPRAYAQDQQARDVAEEAIQRRFDMQAEFRERAFFYMPFMHCEDPAVQERCVELFRAGMPGSSNIRHAEEHCEIVKRFGRFPHRNKTLGRHSTPEEIDFLKTGGFNP